MFKKLIHGFPQELKDRWRENARSTWLSMSRGAAQMAHMRTHHEMFSRRECNKQHGHHNPAQNHHSSKK